ncbi:MAG: hypothetical protein JWR48_2753, partial [Mycobacterium sp.]|nr:hypothetical protein [Mycobacterium sp.]
AQGFAEQHLVVAHAVEVAGVEQGDAGVERGTDGGDALGAVAGPYRSLMPIRPRPMADVVPRFPIALVRMAPALFG